MSEYRVVKPEKHIAVQVFRGNTSEGFEKALRIFKKKVQTAGLFKDLKTNRYFEKPGDKRRRQHRENLRRIRKLDKKNVSSKPKRRA